VEKSRRDTTAENVACEFLINRSTLMKIKENESREGAMGYMLLWLLGIPIPVLLLFFLLRGCT